MDYNLSTEEKWLLNDKYQQKVCPDFWQDCKKLASGEPLAYLIGWVPFVNLNIYLDSRPLIPRTETEFWTKQLIDQKRFSQPKKVLDLGAGSGCISLALAKVWPNTFFTLVEKNVKHHETIKKNIIKNNLSVSHFQIKGGSWFKYVNETFDLIVSNPPYIDKNLNRTSVSVYNYEPHEALFSKQAGTADLTTIIKQAHKYLNHDGEIYLEHEPEQINIINKIATRQGFSVLNHQDQYQQYRFSVLK